MAHIHNEVVIERTPDEVWAVLGDLSAVDWVPGIAAATVDGTTRVCTTDDGPEIHEEIYDYSDEQRTYSYRQVVHPLGFQRSLGTFRVADSLGKARVTWTAELVFGDAAQEEQFLPMLKQGYRAALDGLKAKVETAVAA